MTKKKIYEYLNEDIFKEETFEQFLHEKGLLPLMTYIIEHSGDKKAGIAGNASDIERRSKFTQMLTEEFIKRGVALSNMSITSGEKYIANLAGVRTRLSGFFDFFPPEYTKENSEIYCTIFYNFNSINYQAPDVLPDFQCHMEAICLFYFLCSFVEKISYDLLLKMDYALAELSVQAMGFIATFDTRGPEVDRIFSSKKRMQSKKADRAQTVVEEYYKIKNKDKLSKHRIATMIQDRLKERGIKPPVPETIKRYLRKEGLM